MNLKEEIKLTKSQKVVLRELCTTGETNKAIAAKLFVSQKTIKNHVNAIFKALDVDSRSKAIVKAIQTGLVAMMMLAVSVRAADPPPPCETIIFKPVKQTSFVHGYAFGREDERTQLTGLVRNYYVKLSTANVQGRKAAVEIYKLLDDSRWMISKSTAVTN